MNDKNNENKKAKIGVIGAGYTGLVAAYRLSQAGYKVTLIERSKDLGGLAGDFKIHGKHLEKAYHFYYKTDSDLLSLIDELELSDEQKWYFSSIAYFINNKHYPFMTPMDLIRFDPLSFIDRIRAGVVALYLQLINKWQVLSGYTAYDWLTKFAGEKVRDIIWTPLLKGKFNIYYKDISIIWLWKRIKVRMDSKEKGEATEKLGQLKGGFYSITKGLEDRLREKYVEIKTDTPVTEINKNSETDTITVSTPKKSFSFDKVIITAPSPIIANMIKDNKEVTEEYFDQLQSVNYLGAVILVFSSDQELSNYYWYNINDNEAPFLVFISLTKLVGKDRYNGKNVYYIGAYVPHDHKYFKDNEQKIEDNWFSYVKKMFPNFDSGKVLEKHLFRFRYAQHIVGVGYKNNIPSFATPIKGLYMANFSQIFPDDRGTNYAVRDGNRIAKLVIDDITTNKD